MQVTWIDKDFAADFEEFGRATNMLGGGVSAEGNAALTKTRADRAGRFYKPFALLPCGMMLFGQLTKVVEQHENDEGFKMNLTHLCSTIASFTLPSPCHFKGEDVCASIIFTINQHEASDSIQAT